jgi:(p)ppGpp synthase/HD superfamily hydrolase
MKKGELLGKMLVLATNAHSGQFDKGDNPYILHPIKVMHYLRSESERLAFIENATLILLLNKNIKI